MTHDAAGEDRPKRKWGRVALLVGVLIVGLVAVVNYRRRATALGHPAASLIAAGKTAMQEGRPTDAWELFEQAEQDGGPLTTDLWFDGARIALQLESVTVSEKCLRKVVAQEPSHAGAHQMLAGMLRVAGRNWEVRPHALELFRDRAVTLGNLIALASNELAMGLGSQGDSELEQLITASARAENAIIARLSDARYLLEHNRDDEVLPLLTSIVDEDPGQLEAQARLGALLMKKNLRSDFGNWHRELPTDASTHPEIWMVRGKGAEARGDHRGAARCYWEALRLHPDHQGATYRLSRMLLSIDRTENAAIFSERASRLAELEMLVNEARAEPAGIERIVELMELFGRRWEAWAWCVVAIEKNVGDLSWAYDRVELLHDSIRPDASLVPPAAQLATKIDLADLAVPPWDAPPGSANVADSLSPAGSISFVDSAQSAGIEFSYYNAADPARAYMFEFSGGGVAVLDYDADGWPDLYLTQGCRWPLDPRNEKLSDRLYRNLGNGHFADVTSEAGLQSTGFGQGVCVGDINNDGLPDLYVANIGPNQLYRNNGDGTFTDITAVAGITASQWTVSTLIADLNGDAQPELYDVNYLGGPDVFNKICRREGHPIQCFPTQFPAESDKLFLSLGDGTYRDVSQDSGIVVPDGKGMGIVAADLNGSGQLSLFVANDTTSNFLFVNQTASPNEEPRFVERALLSGLALSESGKAASCMGIAIADVNRDEKLDLFVTNFQDEPNNFYLQSDGLLFNDRIRQSYLHDPGFLMEGWGAQFMDVDADGLLDLVVANGHLDDYPHSDGFNRMPTQVFRNIGRGRFAEVPETSLGPYFEKRYLGRALARLDWNRDGRTDFCVTHVHSPFALLTNQTKQAGHTLVVHLRGTASARDAIGTTVTIGGGDDSWTQQLTAGDGFSASNDRKLMFGLGAADSVDKLTIKWPSGREETFTGLAANTEMLFVEGRPSPAQLDP